MRLLSHRRAGDTLSVLGPIGKPFVLHPEHRRPLLLGGGVEGTLKNLTPVLSPEEIQELQAKTARVHVAPKLADYMLQIAEGTRSAGDFLLGVSTRGVQGLFRATQALALASGRPFATPDDVQKLVVPVLAHRVVVKRRGGTSSERTALERLISSLPVPA